jgi:SpoVK/Ycf46/Vps4 family AAA+-type ATPase
MIVGGIPDKLGNRYEAKWLVRCLIDVIAGKANWLKFEGIDTQYRGFEFALSRGDFTEWHQTKINASAGNWTLNVLNREGILMAFSERLSVDHNAHCFFVSQDSAKDFRTLTDKAHLAESFSQFVDEALAKEERDEMFPKLYDFWRQTPETAFDWLKRCYVKVIPDSELDAINESFGDLYFHQGGKFAFPVLRDILEKNFNKQLSTDTIREVLKQQSDLRFKEWAFDSTIQQRLREETEAYLGTYSPFGAGKEIITRPQTQSLIDELLTQNGPELILLAGVAGSGKSGVVRAAIEKLRQLDIPHLAFRVDQHLQCVSREVLGKTLIGREESPVTTLKGAFPGTPSILFIDQIDAISEVSGRDGQIKEVVFRLIQDAHYFGNIKIVAVCRTFDLDSDPRLKDLRDKNQTRQIDIPLLDWSADVEPLLKKKGAEIAVFKEPQRRLLCLPVNLAVFLEIGDLGLSFLSRSSLHEELLKKKEREIPRQRQISWSPIKALTALCDWMTERQQLSAPISVLDGYLGAADILVSEGLIVVSRGQLNFFHESFFDHIFARAFVNRSQSLVELLASAEQYLFRRTQVRQILESLRQNDPQRYLIELSELLSCSSVRFHIKSAVCQWLNSVENPTNSEFQIVLQFDQTPEKFHPLFRQTVLSTNWFDLLNDQGWIVKQINGLYENRIEGVLWWLGHIASVHPQAIAKLLKAWWDVKPERANRLLHWFRFVSRDKPDNQLLDLCEELILSRPDDLLDYRNDDRASMLLHSWSKNSPEHCGRILHALFDTWFALDPEGNPFINNDFGRLIEHSLKEVSDKIPLAILQGTTDSLVKAINMAVEFEETVNYWQFSHRTYSGYHVGFDSFLDCYRSALKQMLQQSFESAIGYLNKLDPFKHESLMHLHLEAVQANPSALAHRLPNLVSHKSIFDAGFDGADWWSFAHACREAFLVLDMEEKQVVEQVILNRYPEIERSIHISNQIGSEGESEPYWTAKGVIRCLNLTGYEQWCILETIGDALLSTTALSRLQALRRKFPNRNIKQPRNNGVYSVESPIKRPQCEKMSDKHWLAAIKRYDNEAERRRGPGFVDGGCDDLASQLQELTKIQPERFAALSLKIPISAPTCYLQRILWGLAEAESVSDASLIQVIKYADQHPSKAFGREKARIIDKHPKLAADPEILELMLKLALQGEAEGESINTEYTKRETITIDTLLQSVGGLYLRGINGTRGQMWESLANVLWEIPETTVKIWDALDLALDIEPLVSVRCSMLKTLTPLFNADKTRFSNSIRKLIVLARNVTENSDDICLSPLVTHQGIYLFPYIFHWLPELGKELVEQLLGCSDETKQLIGAWMVFCESFRNDTYIAQADNLAASSLQHQRLLADVTADAFSWTGNRHRAEILLTGFFFDEDEETRKHAADVFRKTSITDIEPYRELIKKFVESPAFPGNTYSVLRMLENATGDVLELVISISERLINDSNHNKQRTVDTHHLESLIKKEYAASEFQPESRRRILDVIDNMLANEIYGADDIVAAHDRW